MAEERDRWVYAVDEAVHAAQVVVDHDPDQPRTRDLVPQDLAAAEAGIRQLRRHLDGLPKFAQHAMQGAASSAGQLSDDRLQGLAELIQNADDVGASDACFVIDEANSQLFFAHNGTGLTLHDVLALAVPWLSLKVAHADQLGRYGIGLSTLQSLSDTLEVHEGHFHLRLEAQALSALDADAEWPGGRPASADTVFVVPLEPGVVTTSDIKEWLETWGEAGLVFLNHLSTVTLLDGAGGPIARLALKRGEIENLPSKRGTIARRPVVASDGRSWLLYTRQARTPPNQKRARKANSATTPVALAMPQFDGDTGHLHVGLPVRPIGLPFRIHAQFDPITNRRDVNQTPWTLALIALVAELWADSTLNLFGLNPAAAWSVIPLANELEDDPRTTGPIREAFNSHLMTSARLGLAQRLRLDGGHGEDLPLHELALEVPHLEHILEPADIELLAKTSGIVTKTARSADDRWRAVLSEFAGLGAVLGPVIDVGDALALLDDTDRTPGFVADLIAVAIEEALGDELWDQPCLVINDDTRVAPSELGELDVLLPDDAGDLWDALDIGLRLHPAYCEAAGWPAVSEWLHDEDLLPTGANNADALRAIATAGAAGTELPHPLTDQQASVLRAALEALSDDAQSSLGPEIGRAVRFAATRYDAAGKLSNTDARPADAYIIERDANSWNIAAAKAPGLLWLHRRYHDTLRSPTGRDGLGAQKLFRLLGAETAPRLVPHPRSEEKYQGRMPGVPRNTAGSPQRRVDVLGKHHASYTIGDYASPHLDAVLASIELEKDKDKRRKRAVAVLASLARAWPRLEQRATVTAANTHYGWVDKGRVEAWWISSAATIAWLTSENSKPAAPAALRIKTPSTEALYGDDPGRYLAAAYATSSNTDVLVALGVAQDAGVHELIEKLEHIRNDGPADPREVADVAAPVYKALAAQIASSGSRRYVGTLPQDAVLAAFRRGAGLVATNVGWRSPSVVFSGPAVFGDMFPFAPAINEVEPLWSLLHIHPPGVDDAKTVLRKLATTPQLDADEGLVMLESLRILAAAKPTQLGNLKRTPVWVGDRWDRKRPVYAVTNPLVAQALKGTIPIWSPGGALSQLASLIDPLGLTRIDHRDSQIVDTHGATEDPDLTKVFSRAIANLRADLALSDPAAEASLTLAWDDLATYQIDLLSRIRVQLAEAIPGNQLRLDVDAWLDPQSGTLYVTNIDAAGRLTSGAYAIAAAFTGNTRNIAHAWVVAWAEALAGHESEKLATAASEDAERRREREEADDSKLREFAQRTRTKRSQAAGKASKNSTSGNGGSGIASAANDPPAPLPARNLIDTTDLTIRGGDGTIINAAKKRGPAKTPKKRGGLKEPDPQNQKKPASARRRAPANYTDVEKEDAGMEVVRQVLGLEIKDMIDIRNQHNVGADAIDDLRNFYELKVHAQKIPDQIRLQDSEIQRAYETENFFLVLVGNVEEDSSPTEVRIITDPLDKLNPSVTGHITFTGVQSAKSFQYFIDSDADDAAESGEDQGA